MAAEESAPSILVHELYDEEIRYHIMEAIGATCRGGKAVPVYRAERMISGYPSRMTTVVRVKAGEGDPIEMTMGLGGCGILQPMQSFCYKGYCCAVLPYSEHGSLLSLKAHRFPRGLPKRCITFFLHNTIRYLAAVHASRHVHREISAAHIFVYQTSSVGVSSRLTYAASVHHLLADQFRDSRCASVCTWAAAPEPFSDFSSDIWLIGITALELAYGGLTQLTSRDDLESLINKKLPNRLDHHKNAFHFHLLPKNSKKKNKIAPTDTTQERVFSKAFATFVADCLHFDPSKRPTVQQLLQYIGILYLR